MFFASIYVFCHFMYVNLFWLLRFKKTLASSNTWQFLRPPQCVGALNLQPQLLLWPHPRCHGLTHHQSQPKRWHRRGGKEVQLWRQNWRPHHLLNSNIGLSGKAQQANKAGDVRKIQLWRSNRRPHHLPNSSASLDGRAHRANAGRIQLQRANWRPHDWPNSNTSHKSRRHACSTTGFK